MSSKAFLLVLFLLLLSFASAGTELIIHLDETGQAEFFGESTNKNISLPSEILINERGKITGRTASLTSKFGDYWNFSFYLTDSDIVVYLPKGSKVLKFTGELSTNNNQLSVYGFENVYVQYTIQPTDNYNYLPAGIIIILILIGIILFINKKKTSPKIKSNNKKPDKLKILSSVLNDRENLIIQKLKETGKIKGSRLRKLCEIPKASFSRHIQELERKNIVKRTGEGKNKFVELAR